MKLKSLLAALAVAGLVASSPLATVEAQAKKPAAAKAAMKKPVAKKAAMKKPAAKKAKKAKKAAAKKPGPGQCGTYKYWKAGKCVDKR